MTLLPLPEIAGHLRKGCGCGGSIPYGTVIFPPPGGPDDAYMRLLRKHGLLVMDPSQWPGWSRVPEIEAE